MELGIKTKHNLTAVIKAQLLLLQPINIIQAAYKSLRLNVNFVYLFAKKILINYPVKLCIYINPQNTIIFYLENLITINADNTLKFHHRPLCDNHVTT